MSFGNLLNPFSSYQESTAAISSELQNTLRNFNKRDSTSRVKSIVSLLGLEDLSEIPPLLPNYFPLWTVAEPEKKVREGALALLGRLLEKERRQFKAIFPSIAFALLTCIVDPARSVRLISQSKVMDAHFQDESRFVQFLATIKESLLREVRGSISAAATYQETIYEEKDATILRERRIGTALLVVRYLRDRKILSPEEEVALLEENLGLLRSLLTADAKGEDFARSSLYTVIKGEPSATFFEEQIWEDVSLRSNRLAIEFVPRFLRQWIQKPLRLKLLLKIYAENALYVEQPAVLEEAEFADALFSQMPVLVQNCKSLVSFVKVALLFNRPFEAKEALGLYRQYPEEVVVAEIPNGQVSAFLVENLTSDLPDNVLAPLLLKLSLYSNEVAALLERGIRIPPDWSLYLQLINSGNGGYLNSFECFSFSRRQIVASRISDPLEREKFLPKLFYDFPALAIDRQLAVSSSFPQLLRAFPQFAASFAAFGAALQSKESHEILSNRSISFLVAFLCENFEQISAVSRKMQQHSDAFPAKFNRFLRLLTCDVDWKADRLDGVESCISQSENLFSKIGASQCQEWFCRRTFTCDLQSLEAAKLLWQLRDKVEGFACFFLPIILSLSGSSLWACVQVLRVELHSQTLYLEPRCFSAPAAEVECEISQFDDEERKFVLEYFDPLNDLQKSLYSLALDEWKFSLLSNREILLNRAALKESKERAISSLPTLIRSLSPEKTKDLVIDCQKQLVNAADDRTQLWLTSVFCYQALGLLSVSEGVAVPPLSAELFSADAASATIGFLLVLLRHVENLQDPDNLHHLQPWILSVLFPLLKNAESLFTLPQHLDAIGMLNAFFLDSNVFVSASILRLRLACACTTLLAQRFPNWIRVHCVSRQNSALVSFLRSKVSAFLITQEIDAVRASNISDETFRVSTNARECNKIVAVYTTQDVRMDLTLTFPPDYPITPVVLETSPRIGVTESEWRSWILSSRAVIATRTHGMLEALQLWRSNADKRFEGVQDCMVCVSVFHPTDRSLPKLCCRTCVQKFHAACLYKWFATSGNSTCPLCRGYF